MCRYKIINTLRVDVYIQRGKKSFIMDFFVIYLEKLLLLNILRYSLYTSFTYKTMYGVQFVVLRTTFPYFPLKI